MYVKDTQLLDDQSPSLSFFCKPWTFWFDLLNTISLEARVGFAFIAVVLVAIWYFLSGRNYWIATFVFLAWLGPVVFYMPLFLLLNIIQDSI